MQATAKSDNRFARKVINDEYALVYPGELPVPRLRWEAERDGLVTWVSQSGIAGRP